MAKIYHYLKDAQVDNVKVSGGDYRIIEHDGRCGFNSTSIHTKFEINHHNLNEDEGSVSLWIMSLEDLDAAAHNSWFYGSNPHCDNYNFLSDNEEVCNSRDARFVFGFINGWYPGLWAKFYKGNWQPAGFYPKLMAVVGAGHFSMKKNRWYYFTLTFNKNLNRIAIYVDGILITRSDTVHNSLIFEKIGDTLYGSNPTLALSDICFYDEQLGNEQIVKNYLSEAKNEDTEAIEELKKMYCGKGMKKFDFIPDKSWILKCDRPLNRKEDLEYFYVQGKTDAPSLTDEGIYIQTRQDLVTNAGAGQKDKDALYLWSGDFFEGNLYLEYEFKSLHKDGLSLLMLQCSGMQREDFMKDYPLRADGSMHMVCWEDVRSYHWEYFRNVVDTRNDVASHAMIKNPWLAPMGYSCMDGEISINEWHKLQFLQIENHLQCVIDGKIVLDIYDYPDVNRGPILNCGRFAIRCMIRTKLMIRNLKVYNQKPF